MLRELNKIINKEVIGFLVTYIEWFPKATKANMRTVICLPNC